MRRLLERVGVENVTNDDIDSVFAQIDTNKNNKIDVDEFMGYMYGTEAEEKDVVFRIRKAHLKINLQGL